MTTTVFLLLIALAHEPHLHALPAMRASSEWSLQAPQPVRAGAGPTRTERVTRAPHRAAALPRRAILDNRRVESRAPT
jgi:hypothetical protein